MVDDATTARQIELVEQVVARGVVLVKPAIALGEKNWVIWREGFALGEPIGKISYGGGADNVADGVWHG